MKFETLVASAILTVASLVPAAAIDISGAGATFPYPIYAKWADAYKKETGTGLNYQAIGSGGGIKQIQAKTVTFGASDMPLKAPQLEKDGLVQFPTVLGGVVPVINVEGIKTGDITLDGATLSRIFLGEIKTWNDPAIQKLSPSAKLPARPIVVVHRSDGSGTTFLFTDYLSKVSPAWKDKVGANTAVEWPVGLGAKGNEGVANNVAQTRGSIGYVEYAYAKQNRLSYAKMVNKDGKIVEPTAAILHGRRGQRGLGRHARLRRGADRRARRRFLADRRRNLHPDPQGSRTTPADAAEALKFFDWAYAKGDKMALDLDYVPMPDKVVGAIQKVWAATGEGRGRQAAVRGDQLIISQAGTSPLAGVAGDEVLQRARSPDCWHGFALLPNGPYSDAVCSPCRRSASREDRLRDFHRLVLGRSDISNSFQWLKLSSRCHRPVIER